MSEIFQILICETETHPEKHIVIYKRDKEGKEFLVNMENLPWEEFDGIQEKHRKDIAQVDLERMVCGFAAAITDKETATV